MTYERWSAGPTPPPERPLDRPVWIDLDQLYGKPDEAADVGEDPLPDGLLVATGRVPGLLTRWTRSVDGRWFGLVNFAICDPSGAVRARLERAPVPAVALSEREMEPYR